MTALQERKARRMFEIFDANKDGIVERNDFNLILDRLSDVVPFSKQSETYRGLNYLYQNRWQKMRFYADKDHDEKITVEEWLSYYDSLLQKNTYEEDILPITCYVIRLFADQNSQEDFKVTQLIFERFFEAYGIDNTSAQQTFDKLDTGKKGYLTENQITGYWREFYESNEEEAVGNYFFGSY